MEFRKFTLSDEEFNRLRELVFELAGISLSDAKRELVISRFSKRLRVLNLNSFSDYYNLMRSGGAAAEVQNFINSITTNKTDFFRENHHFQFLVDKFIPDVVSRNQREVRIWSAGCSTGEEPYTLAMVMRRNLVEPHGIPVKILATDIDTKVLSHGERGIYPERVVEPVPNDYLRNYFLRGKGKNEGFYKAKNTVRDMITFKQLNFIKDPFPQDQSFDVVFCRNVIIYFNGETKKTVLNKLNGTLRTGGYFIIGHSESMFDMVAGMTYLKNTIYQKGG